MPPYELPRALQAVRSNPTVIHPLYTKPPELIAASKRALVDVMGSEEEALAVLLQNPAVLQCGDSLRLQPASQIKSFAAVRAAADRVPAAASRGVVIVLAAVFAANFAIVRSDDPGVAQLAAFVKPVLGAAGATLFLGATYLSAVAESTASAGKRKDT